MQMSGLKQVIDDNLFCILKAPGRDEKVDLHFVAFIERNNSLYELGMYTDLLVAIVQGDFLLRLYRVTSYDCTG